MFPDVRHTSVLELSTNHSSASGDGSVIDLTSLATTPSLQPKGRPLGQLPLRAHFPNAPTIQSTAGFVWEDDMPEWKRGLANSDAARRSTAESIMLLAEELSSKGPPVSVGDKLYPIEFRIVSLL